MINKTGDIFTTTAQAIGHGVNTKGVMGAGIAVQFKNKYPEMYKIYLNICQNELLKPGNLHIYKAPDMTIFNIASQDIPGPNASLEWLSSGLDLVFGYSERNNINLVALPQIGCGIGGLNLEDVLLLIEEKEKLSAVEIELWTYST